MTTAGSRPARVQVRRQPGGGADHDDPVHPVRARAQGAAQPGRAELEGAPNRSAEPPRVSPGVEQVLQLGPGVRVGVLGEPARTSQLRRQRSSQPADHLGASRAPIRVGRGAAGLEDLVVVERLARSCRPRGW